MISIIVSSYNNTFFENFNISVAKSIGAVPYEIIKVVNLGAMGICKAYNIGASKAKFPFLIFAHEDILFHTNNWGEVFIRVFENDPQIGLVGFAGGKYKSPLKTGWSIDIKSSSMYMIGTHFGTSNFTRINKGISTSHNLADINIDIRMFSDTLLMNEEVALLDGMFLATTRKIYDEIKFDEETFKGFHCYDLDYSLQVGQEYKVVVNQNILIEHFSAGGFDARWLEEIEKLNKKWDVILPLSLSPINAAEKRFFEFKSIEVVLRIYKANCLPTWKALSPLFKKNYIFKIGYFNWLVIIYKLFHKTLSYFLSSCLSKLRSKHFSFG